MSEEEPGTRTACLRRILGVEGRELGTGTQTDGGGGSRRNKTQ